MDRGTAMCDTQPNYNQDGKLEYHVIHTDHYASIFLPLLGGKSTEDDWRKKMGLFVASCATASNGLEQPISTYAGDSGTNTWLLHTKWLTPGLGL